METVFVIGAVTAAILAVPLWMSRRTVREQRRGSWAPGSGLPRREGHAPDPGATPPPTEAA